MVDFNLKSYETYEYSFKTLKKFLHEKIFLPGVQDQTFTKKVAEKKLQAINAAFKMTAGKFQNIERNSGGMYFGHQIRVVLNMLNGSKYPTVLKTFIAILHDSIEDTDKTFEGIQEDFRDKVAFGVHLISKKPFSYFIEAGSDDEEILEDIRSTKILNKKGLLSDEFLDNLTNHPERINKNEYAALEKYKSLSKKYKKIKNEDFFAHMSSLENFLKYARNQKEGLGLKINNAQVEEVALESLEVKFWDRIDNLHTTEYYTTQNKNNLEKAKRKIVETKKYFYHIALEFDKKIGTDFYSKIKHEIYQLESFIIIHKTKKQTD